MINMAERDFNPNKEKDLEFRRASIDLRVAIPGIIQSFDAGTQTVVVKPAIRECLVFDGEEQWMDIPLLVDVPIVIPRAGGYALTLPIQPGDECLVVFGDMCMDGWWQSGGTQNQVECRRHDLSDGFAIIGVWSQPHVLPAYSTGTTQLRNEAGTSYFEIDGDTINIVAANGVNIKAPDITSTGTNIVNTSATFATNAASIGFSGNGSGGSAVSISGSDVNISGSGNTIIDGKNFLGHTHTGVQTGGGNTGGVA